MFLALAEGSREIGRWDERGEREKGRGDGEREIIRGEGDVRFEMRDFSRLPVGTLWCTMIK